MRRAEVLSPAGDMEKLKVAIAYGADAVYLSGKSFGLRAGSGNFTRSELREGIQYAHARGVRCYVTMNVLAHPSDMLSADDEILFLADAKADAIIVSDPGIFRRIRLLSPQTEIHISTQASTTNAEACLFWYELGARRIVLAREMTLDEIRLIRAQIPSDMSIECFVHGAMCVAYSGRCLLSGVFTGRSANSGACAQPCRWKYKIVEEKRPDQPLTMEEDEHGSYLLNSKDICMIDHIPELLEAGVDSLKIEGRIKGAFYAASVTHVYRQAVDRYYADPSAYTADPDWKEILNRTVHREFGTGFYWDNPRENAQIFPGDTYIRPAYVAGMVIGYDREKKAAVVSQRNKIYEGDELSVLTPTAGTKTSIRAVGMTEENGTPITSTPRAMMTYYLPCEEPLPVFTFLSRTGDKDRPSAD